MKIYSVQQSFRDGILTSDIICVEWSINFKDSRSTITNFDKPVNRFPQIIRAANHRLRVLEKYSYKNEWLFHIVRHFEKWFVDAAMV